MIRYIRIAILLTILVVVAGDQWLTKIRLDSWKKPLWMTVYPIAEGQSENVQRYVRDLRADSFRPIAAFLRQQGARYGRRLDTPLMIQLARPLKRLPPPLPDENVGLAVAIWSMKMRWWAWRNGSQDGLAPAAVRMFVIYQEMPAKGPLERSVGVRKAGLGIVNAVASPYMAGRNRVVITHELMHLLGATDKYDLGTGQPANPDGLAEPHKTPPYPQTRAEIMGGRIAVSAHRWRNPMSLADCVVGRKTATEIGWL